MKKLASSLLLFALLLQADFQPSRWKFRRPLTVDASARIAVWNVDRGTYVHSQSNLSDLRVVSGQDEVPYVLEKMSGSDRREDVSGDVIDKGVKSSRDLELTVDVGRGHRHNGIRLRTRLTNFRQRVAISTSDNGSSWTRVRDDGYIFDFSQDNRQVSVLYVSYPESTRPYVRMTIYGWKDPNAVTRCWVTVDENRSPVRDTMASLKPEPQQDSKTQSTSFTWDLGVAGIPHDQLSLEVDTPAFQRAAAVETSTDGNEWYALGLGVLSKFTQEQSLNLDFSENQQRYLRLRIFNRDDRPLAVKSATLSVIRTRVKFKPAGGGAHWLYYGNADTHAPSYDLRDLLAREAPGPETPSPPELKNRTPTIATGLCPPNPGVSSILRFYTLRWRWPWWEWESSPSGF